MRNLKIKSSQKQTQLIRQNHTMCREDTTLTQAMHKRRESGDIKLVLCIPLMLCESETQQEIMHRWKLSLEGCKSSGLLMIPRSELAEIPYLNALTSSRWLPSPVSQKSYKLSLVRSGTTIDVIDGITVLP